MSIKHNLIIPNKANKFFLLVILLFFVLGSTSCYFYDNSRKIKYPKKSEVVEVELRAICSEIILPSDFKKVSNEVAYTYYNRAFISNRFTSNLETDEVKRFFVSQFSEKGWSFNEWSHLDGKTIFFRFEKEAYEISIECNTYLLQGRKQYDITCQW